MLMGWAVICWMASGAEVLAGKELSQQLWRDLVLAAFVRCGLFRGIRPVFRLMVWALLVTASMSILLGIMDLEPLPGQSRLPGELEWFHGVGLPFYAVARMRGPYCLGACLAPLRNPHLPWAGGTAAAVDPGPHFSPCFP